MEPISNNISKVNKNYSNKSLFNKISKVFKLAGKGLIEKVFLLYSLLRDENIPGHTKLTIISGLSYFILPFDAIPDFLIGIGFTDDLTVLLGILYLLNSSITEEHKNKATELTLKYFD
ncbi:MAG: hypothetical protein A2X64_10680 [Ignavibacteria bacterium GWF2_33_9]|nr:MAG: hypothetical protein A2X64_10680 [Ignavibacteria bacterium GWF2_33_9]